MVFCSRSHSIYSLPILLMQAKTFLSNVQYISSRLTIWHNILENKVKGKGTCDGKAKSKVHPGTGHKGPQREQMHSSSSSLTSALDGSGRLTTGPGRFTPGKETLYLLYRTLDGTHSRSGWNWKISIPPEFETRTVKSLYPLRHIHPVRTCNSNFVYIFFYPALPECCSIYNDQFKMRSHPLLKPATWSLI
jgi:hypothetical protein